MSEDAMPAEPSPIASILAWRYEYRFVAPDRVDIDVHLTFRKRDETPIVVGASLFAAGDTTPSGVVDAGAGVYDVMLPIRNFRCIPWTPHTVAGGAQKRYLLNMKLTAVPESEFDEPDVFAFLGGTIGFRQVDLNTWSMKPKLFLPRQEDADELALRARLAQAREAGVDLIVIPEIQSETLYQLCDELGIAVAQEYTVGETTQDEILRLRRHPCLTLWMDDTLADTGPVLAAEEPLSPFGSTIGLHVSEI